VRFYDPRRRTRLHIAVGLRAQLHWHSDHCNLHGATPASAATRWRHLPRGALLGLAEWPHAGDSELQLRAAARTAVASRQERMACPLRFVLVGISLILASFAWFTMNAEHKDEAGLASQRREQVRPVCSTHPAECDFSSSLENLAPVRSLAMAAEGVVRCHRRRAPPPSSGPPSSSGTGCGLAWTCSRGGTCGTSSSTAPQQRRSEQRPRRAAPHWSCLYHTSICVQIDWKAGC
jgi:hypothetical protein